MKQFKVNKMKMVFAGLTALAVTLSTGAFAVAGSPRWLDKNDHGMRGNIERTYWKGAKQAGGQWFSLISTADTEGRMNAIVEDEADTVVDAYSVNKLAVALAVMDKVDKGQIKLDQKLTLTPDIIAQGSGIYHLQTVYGDNLTVANLMTAMLLVSDNTAVRMLSQLVPGTEVNEILAAKGFEKTRVEPVPNSTRFFLGVTTPREMHKLLEGYANKSLLSAQSTDFVLNIMKWVNGYNDGIRRNMSSDERNRVATKYGAYEDSRNEVGIMFDANGAPALIYSMFTKGLGDINNYGSTNPAVEVHAKLGRLMFDNINGKQNKQPKAHNYGQKFEAKFEQ